MGRSLLVTQGSGHVQHQLQSRADAPPPPPPRVHARILLNEAAGWSDICTVALGPCTEPCFSKHELILCWTRFFLPHLQCYFRLSLVIFSWSNLPLGEHLAMCRDIVGYRKSGHAVGNFWTEARHAGKYPARRRTIPWQKYPTAKLSHAEAQKPWTRGVFLSHQDTGQEGPDDIHREHFLEGSGCSHCQSLWVEE